MRKGQWIYNYQNQQKMIFDGVGQYGIPRIEPVNIDAGKCRWVSFNYALTEKHPEDAICHFYLDDYQFERLWRYPDKYINLLSRFKAITSPDFSLYTDYPKALQVYNHFRKHWLAAYYQMHGIAVIPTICWSNEDSFDFCFDGEPECAIVTVSDMGCLKSKEAYQLFANGFRTMIERLNPRKVYLYTSAEKASLDDIGMNMLDVEVVRNSRVFELRSQHGRKRRRF